MAINLTLEEVKKDLVTISKGERKIYEYIRLYATANKTTLEEAKKSAAKITKLSTRTIDRIIAKFRDVKAGSV